MGRAVGGKKITAKSNQDVLTPNSENSELRICYLRIFVVMPVSFFLRDFKICTLKSTKEQLIQRFPNDGS